MQISGNGDTQLKLIPMNSDDIYNQTSGSNSQAVEDQGEQIEVLLWVTMNCFRNNHVLIQGAISTSRL